MSSSTKILIGILTFLPIVGLIVLVVMIVSLALDPLIQMKIALFEATGEVPDSLIPAVIGLLVLSLYQIGLMAYYVVHAFKNPAVDENGRIKWLLLFVFVGIITMPVYFFSHILPSPEQRAKSEPFQP